MAIKHTFRKNGAGALTTASLTPIKAIRQQCLECVGWQVKEITDCTSTLCPLFPFRMGKTHSGRAGGKNFLKSTLQTAKKPLVLEERQAEHR
jgi:hypothetical protein